MAIELTWPLTSDGAGAVTYTANDWRTLLTNLFGEGILGAGSFEVTERAAGANMQLDIAAGVGVLAGDDAAGQGNYLVEATETLTAVTIGAADATNPRIDLVGIQLRDPSEGGAAGRDCIFSVVAGTPAGSPSAPAAPDSFLTLSSVLVGAGVTSIVDANITDLRVHTTLTHDVVDDANASRLGTATSGADTLVRRTSDGRFGAADPTSALNVANKQWTEANFAAIPAAGGAVSSINYRKLGGLVFLWGTASGGETIPAGYRPAATVRVMGPSTTSSPNYASLAVSSAGAVSVAWSTGTGPFAINAVYAAA